MKKKKTVTKSKRAAAGTSPASAARAIDAKIKSFPDWRGKALAKIRAIIKQADPGVIEEVKWRGVPVWSHGGILCTGETYKTAVKMTFARGASLKDPNKLFNASLEGNMRRAIDVHEGETINAPALKALIREALAFNTAKAKTKSAKRK